MPLHKSISLHKSVCKVRDQEKTCFRDRSSMWFLQQRPRLANTSKEGRFETKLKHQQGWLCAIWCVSPVRARKWLRNGWMEKYWGNLCHTLTINTFKYCFKEVLTVSHPTEELCLTKQRSCGLRGISVQHESQFICRVLSGMGAFRNS